MALQLVGTRRKYGNRPSRTRSFNLSIRCTDGSLAERLLVSDRPRRSSEKQARKGNVFAFEPDTSFACCKKKCASFYANVKNPVVEQARLPLYDHLSSRDAMRGHLKRNWDVLLRLPDGSRCCKRMMLKIYNCSSSLIYGDKRQHRRFPRVPHACQADANTNRTKVGVSIAAWFELLKETADCMPDEATFQVNIPMRSMVFENYNADAEESNVFLKCKSKSYFCKVWHDSYPEIKLRKHCRFAKCDFCVHWRAEANDWARKAEATQRLVYLRLCCSVLFCCVLIGLLFVWNTG
jgi:hypothetical protein